MPRLLSILKDRNCKAQINERSLKKYFSAAVSPSLIGRWAKIVGLKQRKSRFNPSVLLRQSLCRQARKPSSP